MDAIVGLNTFFYLNSLYQQNKLSSVHCNSKVDLFYLNSLYPESAVSRSSSEIKHRFA